MTHPLSRAALAANRANAQKSTGPRTQAGKLRTRFNSLRHGVYARSGDAPLDEALIRRVREYEQMRAPLPKKPGRLYDTANVRMLDAHIAHAKAGQIILDYGPPGTQKTFVFEYRRAEAIERDPREPEVLYVCCAPAMSAKALLAHLALELRIYPRGSRDSLMAAILSRLGERAKLPALLVDEAHRLERQYVTIETLRDIADHGHVGMVIAGHDNLENIFRAESLVMEQWVSRVDQGHRLPGLSEAEVRQIAENELGPRKARVFDGIVAEVRVRDARMGQEYFSMRRLVKLLRQVARS
jgi:DNA transposition AAA+ family ATPase